MLQALKLYSETAAALVKAALEQKNAGDIQGDGTFEVLATSEAVDRDGEVVKADGWDLENYIKNPVVLWAHDYRLPPIGAITSITKVAGGLQVQGVFAKTEFGQQVRQLYDDGIIRAVSVGFIAKERTGNVITKQELLEVSFVPVPANAEALTLRRVADVQEAVAKMVGDKVEFTKAVAKGPIADNVAAREETTIADWEAKWDELDEIWAIIYALQDVYLRPETPVESFKELLVESIALLQAEVDETEAEEVSGVIVMAAKSFKGRYKAGRVLSAKNKEKMEKAMQHALDGHACLKDIMDGIEADADAGEEAKGLIIITDRLPKDERELILSAVRTGDKAMEHAITLLKSGRSKS
jgi:HK97 family phage prohead protease